MEASILEPTTDGVVTIRPPLPGDAATLVAGRDAESRRWLGPGHDQPRPLGCILVDGRIVGWVDYDVDRPWLEAGEVNVGYSLFAAHRGRGYATRAVHLLLHHLAVATDFHTATLLIDRQNRRSLAVAARICSEACGDLDGNPYFKRQVPPLVYSDGVVSIRRQSLDDLERDLEAKDGPKWRFAIDLAEAGCVGSIDCDLANAHVPRGEANVSYTIHPAYRGRGCATRAVRLMAAFLRDHTGAREAHLIVDVGNVPSRRVAQSAGGVVADGAVSVRGGTMLRYVLEL